MTEARQSSVSNQLISRKKLLQLVRSQLQLLLESGNLEGAKAILIPVQVADIAEAIEGLPEAMQAIAFRLLSKDEAIEVYEYLSPQVQQALLEDFQRQDVLDIIDKMSPDDRARLFEELPAKVVHRLLAHMSREQKEATALLLGYKPNTAGRIMTTEYISLKEGWTIDRAFRYIRHLEPASETIYVLYITDPVDRLTGSLTLRELVTSQPEQLIGDMMNPNVICVSTDTEQKEVARVLQRYDLLAIPVVDTENRLVGIVTVDDVIDILEAETTKNIHTLVGVNAEEQKYFRLPVQSVVSRRAFWLIVVLLTNALTSIVMKGQQELLEKFVGLVAFIPLLIDTGGDIGSQSSTVVIRGLHTETIRSHGFLWVVTREAIAGVLLGLVLGLAVIVWAYFLEGDWIIAIIVGISLLIISVLSTVAGAALPFIFSFLRLDPALMSAPFITTIADVLGVIIYLSVAKLILYF